MEMRGGNMEEMPLKVLAFAIVASFVVLFLATFYTSPIGFFMSFIVVTVSSIVS